VLHHTQALLRGTFGAGGGAQGVCIGIERLQGIRHVLKGGQHQVRDRGIGIPARAREHLFERYFRGSNATGIAGTGVGLHLVSMVVALHRGEVFVESWPLRKQIPCARTCSCNCRRRRPAMRGAALGTSLL